VYKFPLLIILIFFVGAFSAAETALTSLSPAKVKAISKNGRFGSKAILKLKSKPQRFLITILICNTLVNIIATVVVTFWAAEAFGSTGVGVAMGFLTLLILLFGEITPKTLAQKYSEKVSRSVAYPLLFLTKILYPVIWLIERFTQGLIGTLNMRQPIHSVSEDELLALVDIGAKEGVIQEHEQELIENVLEFRDTTAEEVMTQKKDMEVLKADTPVEEAAHYFLTHSHTRIPVFHDSINNIIGVVSVHDILKFLYDPRKNKKTLEDFRIKPPIVVPTTKSINSLFREFQNRRQHIAIVVDEHGETAGLITMEDILEELVGEIVDEQDREEKKVRRIGKNEWVASGEAEIDEVNQTCESNLNFPEHDTVSLLILEKLHRFPKLGEKVIFENLIFQVKQMSPKKIETVIITKVPEPQETENQM